jgi:hypothetical protein
MTDCCIIHTAERYGFATVLYIVYYIVLYYIVLSYIILANQIHLDLPLYYTMRSYDLPLTDKREALFDLPPRQAFFTFHCII